MGWMIQLWISEKENLKENYSESWFLLDTGRYLLDKINGVCSLVWIDFEVKFLFKIHFKFKFILIKIKGK
jgi:hypothetical protein